jgi:hypothetical protein
MRGIIGTAGLGTAIVLSCGLATAQSSPAGNAGQTSGDTSAGASPATMTCGQLASVDPNSTPFLVYYLAGFNEGQVQALRNGGVSASTGLPAGQATTAPAATGKAAASQGADKVTTGQPGGSSAQQANTAAAQPPQVGNGGVSQNMAAAQETSTAAAQASPSPSPGANAQPGSVAAGFVPLDIAAIQQACAASPQALAVDVISAQGSGR